MAQRWILTRIRHRTFFSLAELNEVIAKLLDELNRQPFKRLPGCRLERFAQVERTKFKPLPAQRHEFAEWSAPQRIGPDYHALVHHHWYSVPHHLVGESVEARATGTTVELFHLHQRVASHVRSFERGEHTTDPRHMPGSHRAQADKTPERYLAWAEKVGPNLLAVVHHQFEREFPMLGLPACDSLRRLARQYGPIPLEQAAARAVEIKSLTVKSVKSLLSAKARPVNLASQPVQGALPLHHNVRGANYYGSEGD